MSRLTKLSRMVVPVFSLALLACYVVYSHLSAQALKISADKKAATDQGFRRLPHDVDPLTFVLNPSSGHHHLQRTMGDQSLEGALPFTGSKTVEIPQIHQAPLNNALFETRQPVMMAGSKSGNVHFVWPLQINQGAQSSIESRGETVIGLTQPISAWTQQDSLADPVAVKTILTDDGAAAARSGRLWTSEKLWADFNHHLRTMASSSKSGPVFPPLMFQPPQPLFKSVAPISP